MHAPMIIAIDHWGLHRISDQTSSFIEEKDLNGRSGLSTYLQNKSVMSHLTSDQRISGANPLKLTSKKSGLRFKIRSKSNDRVLPRLILCGHQFRTSRRNRSRMIVLTCADLRSNSDPDARKIPL